MMEDQEHITPIDQHVIDFILKLRTDKKLSQDQLAALLSVKRSFIGNIESTNNRAKYNFRHINILADYFDMSPRDFLPALPLPHYYPGREKKIKKTTKKASSKTSFKAKRPIAKKSAIKKRAGI